MLPMFRYIRKKRLHQDLGPGEKSSRWHLDDQILDPRQDELRQPLDSAVDLSHALDDADDHELREREEVRRPN